MTWNAHRLSWNYYPLIGDRGKCYSCQLTNQSQTKRNFFDQQYNSTSRQGVFVCVHKWVKQRGREHPGTKGLELGPGLVVWFMVWGWEKKKWREQAPLTSLVELFVGQEHRTMSTDEVWHYKRQTVAYICGFQGSLVSSFRSDIWMNINSVKTFYLFTKHAGFSKVPSCLLLIISRS